VTDPVEIRLRDGMILQLYCEGLTVKQIVAQLKLPNARVVYRALRGGPDKVPCICPVCMAHRQ